MTSSHLKKYSFWRIAGIIFCLLCSGASTFMTELIKPDQWSALTSITCSVFPVLFGFSITVMTIAGGMDTTATFLSWERLQIYQDTFEGKLIRQCLLGVSCFITIIFSVILHITPQDLQAFYWLSKIFVFFGSFSLLIALTIPFSLFMLYSEKYDQIIDEKRSAKH